MFVIYLLLIKTKTRKKNYIRIKKKSQDFIFLLFSIVVVVVVVCVTIFKSLYQENEKLINIDHHQNQIRLWLTIDDRRRWWSKKKKKKKKQTIIIDIQFGLMIIDQRLNFFLLDCDYYDANDNRKNSHKQWLFKCEKRKKKPKIIMSYWSRFCCLSSLFVW